MTVADRSERSPTRAWCRGVLLGLIPLTGCGTLAGDHRGRAWLNRAVAPLAAHARSIPAWPGAATQRLRHGVTRGQDVVNRAIRSTSRLAQRSREAADGELDDLARFPGEVAGRAERAVSAGVVRGRRLLRPDEIVAPGGAEVALARRVRGLRRAGTTLQLDRPVMVEDTDPQRWTGAGPPPRRRTWLERVLGRIRP